MPYGVPRPISVVGLAAGQLLLEDMRVTVLPKQQGRRRPLSRLADRATDFDVELELRVRASEATAAGTPLAVAAGWREGARSVALPALAAGVTTVVVALEVGLYLIVTLQYSSTALYQVSYHIQYLFFLK